MKNLYIMIIYRCHNYLRKKSNKTIEILFKISGRIQPPSKSILNLVSKKYKMSNFIIIMVEKLLNIMLITCREHSDHQKKNNHHCHHCLLCYLHTHLHGVSSYLQSVHKSSHSNCMGLSIHWYAPCKHVLHRQPLWHTQMCTPYIYNTIRC